MLTLSPVMRKFILHWGEMGTKWGVNRTVAQIHALLYICGRPLHAEEIAEALEVARSNVSTSIRELQSWQIVRTVHVMGDRRDHFETLADVWEMFQIVLEERKKREIDPTMRLLRECLNEVRGTRLTKQEKHIKERLSGMLEFFETVSAWYDNVRRLPRPAIKQFVKLGGKLGRLVGA